MNIKDVRRRLDALHREETQLWHVLWERIIPFAARDEYSRYHDISKVTEAYLRERSDARIDYRILTDVDAEREVFVEVSIEPHSHRYETGYIEVKIPADVFYADHADYTLFWERKHRAEKAAEEAAALARKEASDKANAAKALRKEQRDLALLAELKRRYEKEQ